MKTSLHPSACFVLAATLVACRASSSAPVEPAVATPVASEGTIEVTPVVWPVKSSVDRALLAALPAPASAAVARSRVPVMVPKERAMLARSTILAEPLFYAFFSSIDGVNVSLQGTRGAYRQDDAAPIVRGDTVRGQPAIVSETDHLWTATWVENRVAYALTVECARAGDARCTQKAYVIELADGLAYVGGANGEER